MNSYFMNNSYYSENKMFWYGYIPLYEFLMDIKKWRTVSWANAYDWIQATKIAKAVHESLSIKEIVYINN